MYHFFVGGGCLVPEFQSARLKIIVYFVDLKIASKSAGPSFGQLQNVD